MVPMSSGLSKVLKPNSHHSKWLDVSYLQPCDGRRWENRGGEGRRELLNVKRTTATWE